MNWVLGREFLPESFANNFPRCDKKDDKFASSPHLADNIFHVINFCILRQKKNYENAVKYDERSSGEMNVAAMKSED